MSFLGTVQNFILSFLNYRRQMAMFIKFEEKTKLLIDTYFIDPKMTQNPRK